MDKVYLTLLTLTRNSERYIVEHALFHHLVGFDRLIYVLHLCEDSTEQKLTELKEKLGIDIIIHKCKTVGRVQMGVYVAMIEKYKDTTAWLLPLDDDEYVYSANPSIKYSEDLKGHLRDLDRDNIAGVSFHSKVFGPNSHIVPPACRLTGYTERLPITSISNYALKTFIKPNRMIEVMSPHIQQMDGKVVRFDGKPFQLIDGWRTAEAPIWTPVCFNHYYTGSIQCWSDRQQRGSTNDLRPAHAYSMTEFIYHTGEHMEQDETIQRYTGWLDDLMEKVNA